MGSEVAETEEPPVKRQLMAKGQSKVLGKGKSGAPVTTAPTASTKTKTESTKIFETPKTECMETEQRFAPRLPPCAKQPMSQVEVDLVLSTDRELC